MKHEGDQQARILKIKGCVMQKLFIKHLYRLSQMHEQCNKDLMYCTLLTNWQSLSTFLQIPWMAEDFKRWKRKDWSDFWRGWRILVGL